MATATYGKSIKLFLVDGTTSGLWSAEVSASWTGRMFRVSKAKFDALNEFEDASGPGTYFLIGDLEANGKRQVYIGESDNVLKRLLQHDTKGEKVFWKDTILIVSKDENLTKAHTLYLESRLIDIAARSGQVALDNGTTPVKSLPRPDQSDMEYFIDQILLVMPVMGHTFLIPAQAIAQVVSQQHPLFVMKVGGVTARMEVRGDDEFVVLQGSNASGEENESINAGYSDMRAQLIKEGTLQKNDHSKNYEFTKNVKFSSPSRAAVVVYGGNISGPKYWQLTGTNQTYGEWIESQTRKAIPEAPKPTDATGSEQPSAPATVESQPAIVDTLKPPAPVEVGAAT